MPTKKKASTSLSAKPKASTRKSKKPATTKKTTIPAAPPPTTPLPLPPPKASIPKSRTAGIGSRSFVCGKCRQIHGSYGQTPALVLAIIAHPEKPCEKPGCGGTVLAPSLSNGLGKIFSALQRTGYIEYVTIAPTDVTAGDSATESAPRHLQLTKSGQEALTAFLTDGRVPLDVMIAVANG